MVLEYGIFSGGISIGLAKLSRAFRIIIGGLEFPELIEDTGKWIRDSDFSPHITISGALTDFKDDSFDLVVCRGFFFYLDNENILQDIMRVLKPGGIAVLGGGYGEKTPPQLIDEISQKSRILNERLGRTWFTKEELVDILKRNELLDKSEIIEKGGLWIRICKDKDPVSSS